MIYLDIHLIPIFNLVIFMLKILIHTIITLLTKIGQIITFTIIIGLIYITILIIIIVIIIFIIIIIIIIDLTKIILQLYFMINLRQINHLNFIQYYS